MASCLSPYVTSLFSFLSPCGFLIICEVCCLYQRHRNLLSIHAESIMCRASATRKCQPVNAHFVFVGPYASGRSLHSPGDLLIHSIMEASPAAQNHNGNTLLYPHLRAAVWRFGMCACTCARTVCPLCVSGVERPIK